MEKFAIQNPLIVMANLLDSLLLSGARMRDTWPKTGSGKPKAR